MPEIGDKAAARYKDQCARTGDSIWIGDSIVYSQLGWEREASVAGLEPIPDDAIVFDGFTHLNVGTVLREKNYLLPPQDKRIVVVLACTRKFYPNQGDVYYYCCRVATDEEAKPLLEKEAGK